MKRGVIEQLGGATGIHSASTQHSKEGTLHSLISWKYLSEGKGPLTETVIYKVS